MTGTIDFNCDAGEGMSNEREILPFVSSVSVACGAHAGNAATMRRTVVAARDAGVAVGAHPGFADREHFGRRELPITPDECYRLVLDQVSGLAEIAAAQQVSLRHVKPHGALYNMAAANAALAEAAARAVYDFDPQLFLFGLAGSRSITAGRRVGLRVVSEVFADRNYQRDGALLPRSDRAALVKDAAIAADRVVRMVRDGVVRAVTGEDIPVVADSVCIHGDGRHAVAFARDVNRGLREAGIEIRAPSDLP